MVWDVIFIVQSSNPPCSFLTTFFFFTLFTSLCSRSFLALISAIFVVTCSARSGITSTELQLFEPGVDAYQYLRPREVYPGQMVDDPCDNISNRVGYKSKLFLFFFFETALRVPMSRHFIFGATCGGPECEKVYSTFQVLCAVHCILNLQFLYLDLYL